MKDGQVISIIDEAAAHPDNRTAIEEYLNAREAINAFRAYPDGRDTGAVENSDAQILQGLDEKLSQALRSGGALENLDGDTYRAWLVAVDAGHDVHLESYDPHVFALQLETQEALEARRAALAKKRASFASQDGGEDAGQAAVDELRAKWRAEPEQPTTGGRLRALVSRALGRDGPADDNTHG